MDMLERYEAQRPNDKAVMYTLRHLRPFFKDVALSQFCRATVREYIEHRMNQPVIIGRKKSARTVSRSTVRRELDTLSAALHFAYREGFIAEVPYIEKPAPSKPRERWLTHQEAGQLLAAASSNKRLLAYIEIAMNTGARPSSIMELKWFQVDLEKRLIHFNPEEREQTRKFRPTVYINDSLLPTLQRLHDKKNSEYVLGGIKSVKHQFKRACERSKLVGVTPYTLRHTAITWAVREGHSLALAGQLAGHKDPRTTMRYAKHDPSFTEGVVGALATGAQLAHNFAEQVKNEKKATKKVARKQTC